MRSLAEDGAYSPDAAAAGRRALRNAALDLYAAANADGLALAETQFTRARFMTDKIAGLGVLALHAGAAREARARGLLRDL